MKRIYKLRPTDKNLVQHICNISTPNNVIVNLETY